MASSGGDDGEHNARQLERLSFFSDAVFAIAMTLLVVEVKLPELEQVSEAALGQHLLWLIPNYVGFVVSFLVIGRFWVGHHTLFGHLRASSSRLVWANLFFLLAVAFMPFPTAVFSNYVQLRVAVALYTGWFFLLGLLNWGVTRAALGDPSLVRPDADPAEVRRRRHGALIPLLIAALAFAAGMIAPLLAVVALALGSPIVIMGVRRMDRTKGAGPDG